MRRDDLSNRPTLDRDHETLTRLRRLLDGQSRAPHRAGSLLESVVRLLNDGGWTVRGPNGAPVAREGFRAAYRAVRISPSDVGGPFAEAATLARAARDRSPYRVTDIRVLRAAGADGVTGARLVSWLTGPGSFLRSPHGHEFRGSRMTRAEIDATVAIRRAVHAAGARERDALRDALP